MWYFLYLLDYIMNMFSVILFYWIKKKIASAVFKKLIKRNS